MDTDIQKYVMRNMKTMLWQLESRGFKDPQTVFQKLNESDFMSSVIELTNEHDVSKATIFREAQAVQEQYQKIMEQAGGADMGNGYNNNGGFGTNMDAEGGQFGF